MNTEMALATPQHLAVQLEPGERDATEQQLVELARAGKSQARETLAEHHRRDAYLLALQLLGNRDVALWFLVSAGFGLWHLANEPGPLLPKLLIFSGIAGGLLLLLSVALDRMIEEARDLGANAILETRFSTSMVAQGAAELMAYGTAVVVKDA